MRVVLFLRYVSVLRANMKKRAWNIHVPFRYVCVFTRHASFSSLIGKDA
jgi:hypothetical protein